MAETNARYKERSEFYAALENIARLSQHLDFIHESSADYHKSKDGVLGAVTPLRGYDDQDINCVDFTIKSLVAHGVPPTKILMGIPFYGRKFSIKETSKSGVSFGKTVVDTGLFHSITGYREICKLLTKSTNWNYFWNEKSSTPYIYNEVENFIFSYENTRSVAMKVKLAVDYGLAGFVTGTLPLDDFDGSCPVEEDTYEDFVDRHFRMVVDAISTRDALRNLNLPTWARIKNDVDYRGYYVAHEKIYLELPKPKVKKFPLLTAIYEAAALAEEEKIIADEINKLKK